MLGAIHEQISKTHALISKFFGHYTYCHNQKFLIVTTEYVPTESAVGARSAPTADSVGTSHPARYHGLDVKSPLDPRSQPTRSYHLSSLCYVKIIISQFLNQQILFTSLNRMLFPNVVGFLILYGMVGRCS